METLTPHELKLKALVPSHAYCIKDCNNLVSKEVASLAGFPPRSCPSVQIALQFTPAVAKAMARTRNARNQLELGRLSCLHAEAA